MKAELIDKMGSDLAVVNAARVSFAKESEWEIEYLTENMGDGYIRETGDLEFHLKDGDQKLIKYLAKHNHWTPFSHVMITMRETVPIFVARQRFKHMVGFTYNEESRRYVSDDPTFFVPDVWRKAAENKKQGSSDEIIIRLEDEHGYENTPQDEYAMLIDMCSIVYEMMIKNGVAPEQARMVLPQSMYTSYYTTGSLAAWARAYKLRSDLHAQKEIRDLAAQWNEIIGGIEEMKYSWAALTEV